MKPNHSITPEIINDLATGWANENNLRENCGKKRFGYLGFKAGAQAVLGLAQAPTPSDPLGVSAVESPRPCDLHARWNAEPVPHGNQADICQGDEVVARVGSETANVIVKWHNDTLPTTPTREPAEGAVPDILDQSWTAQTLRLAAGMPDKLPERLKSMEQSNADWQHRYYLEKDITLSQSLRFEERLLIERTSLAEAKAQLAEARETNQRFHRRVQAVESGEFAKPAFKEHFRLTNLASMWPKMWKAEFDRLGHCFEQAKDYFEVIAKALRLPYGRYQSVNDCQLESAKDGVIRANVITDNKVESFSILEQLTKLAEDYNALRAENERLAALVAEKIKLAVVVSSPTGREQDAAKLALENNDLRTQLTAAQAQIAAMSRVIQDALHYHREALNHGCTDEVAWEMVEHNLTNALSPSCGAELLAKLSSTGERYCEMERRKAHEAMLLRQTIADLTARNAKLEAFAKECAKDDLDRVSGGIKQSARQALDSEKEGGAK